ncbi:MAG: AIM24 family protein [Deltaproteobacteria bacterium]|nr:AIM24 family protein [Deltaproteobacteria bacterium]MBW2361171.1 AIM24 family protein [Deltaproteobacteria bacterium]
MQRRLANLPPTPDAAALDEEPGGAADPGGAGLLVVHRERLDPPAAEDEGEEPTCPADAAQLSSFGLVGSLVWRLRKGDLWVLAPESAFLFTNCWRKTLLREAWMLERETSPRQAYAEGVATMARRWITGEPMLLDLYEAGSDGAELGISSDELGGNLYATRVDRGPVICRKAVHFGSQKGLMLRPTSPLRELSRGASWAETLHHLKRAAYGPGWIFQRFTRRDSDEDTLILEIDGDIYYRELEAGETLRTDPRHSYAWDESVSWKLVRFGNVSDRLLRGSIPFQIEFEGPGRLWLSNMSFGDGYLGSVFTPSHWFFYAQQLVLRVLRALNPFTWI